MRQTGFFHDVSHAGAVIAAAPDGARCYIHNALVGGFFGCGSLIGGFLHDAYHIKNSNDLQESVQAMLNTC
jgi:hypothetical protein